MNLLEAIKSGKRFYRKDWPSVGFEPITFEQLDELSKEEVLAEDWIIEEKEVTITASQFDKAVSRTGKLYHKGQWYWVDALKKELGL